MHIVLSLIPKTQKKNLNEMCHFLHQIYTLPDTTKSTIEFLSILFDGFDWKLHDYLWNVRELFLETSLIF